MIVKTVSGKTFKGCVNYLHNKVQKGKGEMLYSKDLTDDNMKYAIKEMVDQAKTYEDPRFTGRSVWHTSVSFSKEDRVDDELMKKIAKEYLEKNSLDKSQCLVIKHTDTEHQHFHIVANRINSESKLVSDKFTKTKDFEFAREMERKYNLEVANNKNLRKIKLENFKNKSDEQKIKMYASVNEAMKQSTSVDMMKKKLKEKGITMQERGKEFVFTKETNSIDDRSYKFRGSTLDKDLQKEKIIEHVQRQQIEQENEKKNIGRQI